MPQAGQPPVEKKLLLWPEYGEAEKMTRFIEMVTSKTRRSDVEESKRGRFDKTKGGALKDRLSAEAQKYGFNECLKFLYEVALGEIFAEQSGRVTTAKAEYSEGATERLKDTARHAKTLSRLASDLRLQDLAGPVNILRWKGSAEAGRHEPEPRALFERLSNAGDGWYFFLTSVVSFHVFVIAVHVSGRGREFFEIQGGQSVQRSPAQLNAFFDEKFRPNDARASSRVWQLYLRPVP